MLEQTMKSLPLEGLRILNTRTHEQAGTFSSQLSVLGATSVEFPTIRIIAPEDWEPLDNALKRLCEANWYDWLVFTSANGVQICFERMNRLGYHVKSIVEVRIAAIGPATASTLRKYGVEVDLVPATYIAEAVFSALIDDAFKQGEQLVGKRLLLARAAEARNVLVHELHRVGVEVDVVAAYRTVGVDKDNEQGQRILRQLEAQELDIITFTSSSTVRNFMQWLTVQIGSFSETFIQRTVEFARPKIACIGPITSQTARECGLKVHIEAQVYTIAGLVEAIIRNEGKV
ncbi:MAG TPA: uroporphyrinogen-III synthase [Ktedonobacteraceae bacterium]|nr:uroporphyrinogen-III synthase [Ktedonobacteraceae bacterium]